MKALARKRLESDEDRGPPSVITNFLAVIYQMEMELVTLEKDVTDTSIKWTGFNAVRELQDLEDKHSDLIGCIKSAHSAILLSEPEISPRFRKYGPRGVKPEEGPGSHFARRMTFEYQDALLESIGRLEVISARVGSRLDGRRISANTRLVLSISVIAIVVSVLSLI